MTGTREIRDLSHPLEEGVATFPGFPPPRMDHHISFEDSVGMVADGVQFAIDDIRLIGGSSTYIDAPRHFFPAGGDVAGIPIECVLDVPAVVVRAPADGRREYLPEDFDTVDVSGRAVLLATGWDARWATPAYIEGPPYLGGEAALRLVDRGAVLVGIDAVLVDDIEDVDRPSRPAHSALLAAGLPIIENMRGLTELPTTGARLTAIPAAVRGVGSFPVRAVAVIAAAVPAV